VSNKQFNPLTFHGKHKDFDILDQYLLEIRNRMTRKKTKKVDDDRGFEEFKRMQKMWKNRAKLSKKDPADLDFREHQMLAQKFFEDGYEIEAFVVLHGLIEIYLNEFWQFFLFASGIYDEPRIEPKLRSYSVLTEILYEAGLLEKVTYQNLSDFNAHRNLLTHNLFGIKQKKRDKKKTKAHFQNGLNASGNLPLDTMRYLHVEAKRNPKFKKAIKKVFGLTP